MKRQPSSATPARPVRLQKFLAMAGLGSRRACERLVAEGRVRVNRVPAGPGTTVDPGRDAVTVDGRRVQAEPAQTFLFHKPRGYSCTEDERFPGKNLADLHPDLRHFPVALGLERKASGLIVLSSDPGVQQALARGHRDMERVYAVRVKEEIDATIVAQLKKGVPLDGTRRPLARVRLLRREDGAYWYEVAFSGPQDPFLDGLFLAVHRPLQRQVRLAVGPLRDDLLKKGLGRPLTAKERAAIVRDEP